MSAPLRAAAFPCSSVPAHLLRLLSRHAFLQAQATVRPCLPRLPPASSCPGSPHASSQSDTESIASATAALKRDLEVVEAQSRVLPERRARGARDELRTTICLGSSVSLGSRQHQVAYLRLKSLLTSMVGSFSSPVLGSQGGKPASPVVTLGVPLSQRNAGVSVNRAALRRIGGRHGTPFSTTLISLVVESTV